MTIQEAHVDFKVKLNKLDTNQTKNFEPEEIDWLLHEAQQQYFRTRYNQVNLTRAGFEDNQLRIDELSNLHVKFPEQPEITLVPSDNVELKLSTLVKPYYHLTSLNVYDESCKQWLSCVHSKHSDYLEELRNPFNKFTALYNFGRDSEGKNTSIYIYKPVSKAKITYLTYPSKPYIGGYVHPDGVTTTTKGFDLPEFTHPLIVDLAVNEAERIIKGGFAEKVLANN